jgi:hypothetical protein
MSMATWIMIWRKKAISWADIRAEYKSHGR